MHVLVKREDKQSAARAFARYYRLLKDKKSHALMFPEGTRHADDTIHDFFPGFAMLAKKLNRPIIPMYFHGLHEVLSKNSWLLKQWRTTVDVVIGEPITIHADDSVQETVERVHRWFKEQQKKFN